MNRALPARAGATLLGLRVRVGVALVLGLATAACRGGDAGKAGPASPSASAAAPSAPRSVRLEARPAKVGDRLRGVRTSVLTLSIEFWQEDEKLGTNDSSRTEEYARTITVLGLLGGNAARERVLYERYALHEVQADKPPHDVTELAGKTYELDATDGKLVSKHGDGKPVSAVEEATLQKLHGDLGEDEPIVAALGAEPIPVGRAVPLRAPLFKALASSGDGDFKAGTITLAETRTEHGREAAVFQWSGEMHTQEENGLEITWHLTGRAVLGISPSCVLATSISGALNLSGKTQRGGALVTLAGAGTMKDERTVEFE